MTSIEIPDAVERSVTVCACLFNGIQIIAVVNRKVETHMASSSIGMMGQIWRGIKQLNPETVREDANRRFKLGLVGSDHEIDVVIAWLTQGEGLGPAGGMIQRIDSSTLSGLDKPARNCDLVICASNCYERELGIPTFRLHMWNPSRPEETIKSILDEEKLGNLHIALSRWFKVFRKDLSTRIVRSTSFENAVFVSSTAIGTIIPSPLAPLTALAEAAGDLVVLTGNQVRMLFRLAGANGHTVGYKELLPQIGSIIAAAFGWRALAREIIGMVPLGGGLVAKAAVAYAGTWTIGEGIVVYLATGRKMSKEETSRRFQALIGEARQVASQIVDSLKQKVRVLTPGKQP